MEHLIVMSETFHQLPSTMIGLDYDPYASYCFNQAAILFKGYLAQKKKPRYKSDEKANPGLQSLLG